MALWFLPSVSPPPKKQQNTENNIHVSGGHTGTFSYPLMAEIVSSLFPLSQYNYLTVASLGKEKPIYKQWRLTVCTELILCRVSKEKKQV